MRHHVTLCNASHVKHVRLESSCVWLREMVVQYSVYRARLDRMFRAKRLNNYMLLPDSGRCSQQQASTYYKLRLYRYCHRYSRQSLNIR